MFLQFLQSCFFFISSKVINPLPGKGLLKKKETEDKRTNVKEIADDD